MRESRVFSDDATFYCDAVGIKSFAWKPGADALTFQCADPTTEPLTGTYWLGNDPSNKGAWTADRTTPKIAHLILVARPANPADSQRVAAALKDEPVKIQKLGGTRMRWAAYNPMLNDFYDPAAVAILMAKAFEAAEPNESRTIIYAGTDVTGCLSKENISRSGEFIAAAQMQKDTDLTDVEKTAVAKEVGSRLADALMAKPEAAEHPADFQEVYDVIFKTAHDAGLKAHAK
jgi:hypothetical protein